ncbi:MAG TPA: hypothetical protein ENL12_01320 [Dehalococcoidia bacterium]|nr:hypothetical protein [Dehalococcoidia bacterium]
MDGTRRIRIIAGPVAVHATLNDTRAAQTLWNSLPLQFRAQSWGDELYGRASVELEQEEPREVVEAGDLAYWPPGHALCIFFGPTPASRTNTEIRAASEVTVLGHIEEDPAVFRAVKGGEKISLERA